MRYSFLAYGHMHVIGCVINVACGLAMDFFILSLPMRPHAEFVYRGSPWLFSLFSCLVVLARGERARSSEPTTTRGDSAQHYSRSSEYFGRLGLSSRPVTHGTIKPAAPAHAHSWLSCEALFALYQAASPLPPTCLSNWVASCPMCPRYSWEWLMKSSEWLSTTRF
jgi:hypothetical protein